MSGAAIKSFDNPGALRYNYLDSLGGLPMTIQDLFNRIDETKAWIDSRRPLAPEEVKELDAYFRIGTTYSSNALEGNTLTLSETKMLLEDGLTVGGKPIRDFYEAVGHAKAYDFMLEAARSKPVDFSESVIQRLHRLFYQSIDEDKAGVYRDIQVFISGTDYVPPAPEEVPSLMAAFVNQLNTQWFRLHPVHLAAFAHKRLADIHPFIDGNGRTARLLMNLVLINRGYQIVIIPSVMRLDYMLALKKAQTGTGNDDESFIRLIAECEIEAQKDYCRMFHINPPQSSS
jgi:Fic family protein